MAYSRSVRTTMSMFFAAGMAAVALTPASALSLSDIVGTTHVQVGYKPHYDGTGKGHVGVNFRSVSAVDNMSYLKAHDPIYKHLVSLGPDEEWGAFEEIQADGDPNNVVKFDRWAMTFKDPGKMSKVSTLLRDQGVQVTATREAGGARVLNVSNDPQLLKDRFGAKAIVPMAVQG